MPRRGRAITLADLTTHRSGLPRLPHRLLLTAMTRDRRDPYARLDPARLEALIPKTRPKREPDERFRYSNYAVGLLGYLLARRAGTSYERLVRARICEPLGLADTWVQTPEADRGRVATPHDWRGRETGHWHLAALAAAGGLRSTAADLLTFLALHAGRGEPGLVAAARETRAAAQRRRPGGRRAGLVHPARGHARPAPPAAGRRAVPRGRDRRVPQRSPPSCPPRARRSSCSPIRRGRHAAGDAGAARGHGGVNACRSRSHGSRASQPGRWSLTRPIACMNA